MRSAITIYIYIYIATQLGILVYIKRNIKVITKCALKNYNKNRDIKASESSNKDSTKDNGKDNSKDNNKDNRKDKEFQDKIDLDLDKPVKTLYYKHITLILL